MAEQRISCLACGSLESLNICPRCGLAYCCKKCYRSELHQQCSEAFFRECVEQEMRFKRADAKKEPKTFEEFMNEQGAADDYPMDMDGPSNQEMMDSDDEEENAYLEKVKDGCMAEYQSADERELDRQLTKLGIGINNDNLLSSLTDAERLSFTAFYDQLLAQEAGLGRSVFTNKKGSK